MSANFADDSNNIAAAAASPAAREGAAGGRYRTLDYHPYKPPVYFNIWKTCAAIFFSLLVISASFRYWAFVGAITAIILLWTYYILFRVLPYKDRGIPGPLPWTPAGSLFALGIVPTFGLHKRFGWEGGYRTWGGNSLCEGLDAYCDLYGDAYACWLGFDRVIIFSTDAAAKHIYRQSRASYDQAPHFRDRQAGISNVSIATALGDNHRRHIKAVGPMLKRWKLIPFIPSISAHTNRLLDKFQETIANGTQEDYKMTQIYYKHFLLDLFSALAFDHDLRSLDNASMKWLAREGTLGWAILVITETVAIKFISGIPASIGLWLERVDPQLLQARYIIKSYLKNTIVGSVGKQVDTPTNLLDLLISAVEGDTPTLSVDELFDDLTFFLFSGANTSSSMLGFATYWLSKSPDVQQAVREEIWSVLGKPTKTGDWHNDAPIGDDALSEMTLLDCVLKEVIRLSFTSLGSSRQALVDDVIDGVPVKKGDNMMFNAVRMQHDGRLYDRPKEFLPQRWVENPDLPVHAFGGGPRVCVGQDLARLELKVVLCKILRYASIVDTGPLNSIGRNSPFEQLAFFMQVAVPDVRNLRVKICFDKFDAAPASE